MIPEGISRPTLWTPHSEALPTSLLDQRPGQNKVLLQNGCLKPLLQRPQLCLGHIRFAKKAFTRVQFLS